jgi:hypothetical protein
MDEAQWTLVDIVGPLILLVLLGWLAFRWGRNRGGSIENQRAEQGTRELYAEEEIRRREGTDGLEDDHERKRSDRL